MQINKNGNMLIFSLIIGIILGAIVKKMLPSHIKMWVKFLLGILLPVVVVFLIVTIVGYFISVGKEFSVSYYMGGVFGYTCPALIGYIAAYFITKGKV